MLIKGAIFDLDGVITKTADLHFLSWKHTFDDFLAKYSIQHNVPFKEFTQQDYILHVDGVPRIDGIKKFFKSRHILFSSSEDTAHTVQDIAQRKNQAFLNILSQKGIQTYKTSINFIHLLHEKGIKTGIISSSKNCRAILKKAGIEGLFEVRVDGIDSMQRNIPGKPKPDIFLEAASLLGISPNESMVIEDAVMGVEAAKAGNFGLIIGLNRYGSNTFQMKNKGAHIVVADLGELNLDLIEKRPINQQGM